MPVGTVPTPLAVMNVIHVYICYCGLPICIVTACDRQSAAKFLVQSGQRYHCTTVAHVAAHVFPAYNLAIILIFAILKLRLIQH